MIFSVFYISLYVSGLCKDFGSFTFDSCQGKVSLHGSLGACLQLLPYIHTLVVQIQTVVLLSQIIVNTVQVVVQTIKGMSEKGGLMTFNLAWET